VNKDEHINKLLSWRITTQ